MKVRWIGVSCVVIAALAIIVYKQRAVIPAEVAAGAPAVLLVADLNEAGNTGDGCAVIIGAVRAARARGVRVEEFMPESPSPLLKQYRVVSAPTVVFIGKDGRETDRFVGEGASTVQAIKAKLATLHEE